MKKWQDRIVFNPEIRSGKPCIKGTRLTVKDILDRLAEGLSYEEILEDFPEINKEDILAVLAYSAYRDNITQILI